MYTLDYKEYAAHIRKAAAEGCVLLKNDANTLPLQQNDVVAIFGRSQIETYYCGTGSGGMVNIPYLVDFTQGLAAKRTIHQGVLDAHKAFIEAHSFDKGAGWAQQPFSQQEMPLTEQLVQTAAAESDVAVMIIGRLAGEDQDAQAKEGSYYLSETEQANLALLCAHFKKTVVLLNVGGIMDMSFVAKYNPTAVMYAWHGGVESGNAYADVLCGDVNACGSLTDTIAYTLADYPAAPNYGGKTKNDYVEDIFLGYRYFETFCPEKAQYPFGFGLSYTDFSLVGGDVCYKDDMVELTATITNTGAVAGKKAIQVYCQKPMGALCQPRKTLCAFAKSKLLAPTEAQQITFTIPEKDIASFCEETSQFVLEAGEYLFHIGFDSHTTEAKASIHFVKAKCVEQHTHALAPIRPFKRMVSVKQGDTYTLAYQDTPLRRYDIADRIREARVACAPQTYNGYDFEMLKAGKITAEELANDLTDLELIHLTRGEGMCSPKVTPGTAGCIGGVSDSLHTTRKVPIVCCSDGPSGIRMDCGTMAMSSPNGTALASTFDTDLCAELYCFVALEMVKNKIDTLLGPGMNIHRYPLCGRNFEYFSEDPFLTGKMAVAQLNAMHPVGVTGTIKHFALNNQEYARRTTSAEVSERALREIYLRGFEMAVKEGGAYSIMTAYNPINGVQAGSNYDLTTTILRNDWGYQGAVMTDWWVPFNIEGQPATEDDTAAMITAQNDVCMVYNSAEGNTLKDNSETALQTGELSRTDLIRTGKNILQYVLRANCTNGWGELQVENLPESKYQQMVDHGIMVFEDGMALDTSMFQTTKGTANKFTVQMSEFGRYAMDFALSAYGIGVAQISMSVTVNRVLLGTTILQGGTNDTLHTEFELSSGTSAYCELFFGESGMTVQECTVHKCD